MKRAVLSLVSILTAASMLTATAAVTSAYTAHVWSNSDAFSFGCIGVTDTYPQKLYNLNVGQIAQLGYSPVNGSLGASFTRTAFLNQVFNDYAVYVHSHGDNYWAASGAPNIDSGFLQDPGSGQCNSTSRDLIRSSAIRSATRGTSYNLVIMSTCMLGANSSTMPGAFQIEKTKSSSEPEFYMGYVYHAYDSSAYRFEQAFWSYMNGGAPHSRTFSQALAYASSIGGYAIPDPSDPFVVNWWGNPTYDGTPSAG